MAEAKDEAGGRALEFTDGRDRCEHDSPFGRCAKRAGHADCHRVFWDIARNTSDQALSAPAAESGKDRQAFVDFAATVPAPEVTVLAGDPSSEPAPVAEAASCGCNEYGVCGNCRASKCELAEYHTTNSPCPRCSPEQLAPKGAEAPERVTHRQAMDAMNTLSTRPESESLPARRVVRSYITQQEQSERELAELRKRIDEEEGRAADWMDVADERLRQLTAAERKAEGLRVDNEELKDRLSSMRQAADQAGAKLAESERKLGEIHERCKKCIREHAVGSGGWQAAQLIMRGATDIRPASTEPAGVEAGKVDPTPTETEAPARCPVQTSPFPEVARESAAGWGTGDTTDTEAPARFRVGQRVLRKSHTQDGVFFVGVLSDNWARIEQMRMDGAYAVRVSLNEIEPYEPADPAPPKPGAAKLTGPVEAFRAELVEALRKVHAHMTLLGFQKMTQEHVAMLAEELEREGGGKS